MKVLQDTKIFTVSNWPKQLADLTRIAWTGADGRCYFPYLPLTTPKFWATAVKQDVLEGKMHSFALLHKEQIIAHAALVNKGLNQWECGRWVALPDAPKGAVSQVITHALSFAEKNQWQVWVECTQAHRVSQYLCRKFGLRFAGVGFLNQIDGIAWDIIYFDNARHLEPFNLDPRQPQIIANPLGRQIQLGEIHRQRVREISSLLSTDHGGELPPRLFYTLPELFRPIETIIRANL